MQPRLQPKRESDLLHLSFRSELSDLSHPSQKNELRYVRNRFCMGLQQRHHQEEEPPPRVHGRWATGPTSLLLRHWWACTVVRTWSPVCLMEEVLSSPLAVPPGGG